MEILEQHPQNGYSEAHQSGKGMIERIEPQIIEGEYHKAGVLESINDVTLLEQI